MTILDMLKKERLTFGNQLEGLEGQIEKQEEEIEKLKVRFILLKIRKKYLEAFFLLCSFLFHRQSYRHSNFATH
jgi:hypothetical protein